jgi:hypothetical protein
MLYCTVSYRARAYAVVEISLSWYCNQLRSSVAQQLDRIRYLSDIAINCKGGGEGVFNKSRNAGSRITPTPAPPALLPPPPPPPPLLLPLLLR